MLHVWTSYKLEDGEVYHSSNEYIFLKTPLQSISFSKGYSWRCSENGSIQKANNSKNVNVSYLISFIPKQKVHVTIPMVT